MFEETGLKLDTDFFWRSHRNALIPAIRSFKPAYSESCGGVTPDSTEVAAHLYSQIVKDVHAVSSARVAERQSYWRTTFRAVTSAWQTRWRDLLRSHIDTWEVIRAAATKPFGFMPFYPGPGIGGPCIPLDRIICRGRRANTASIRALWVGRRSEFTHARTRGAASG